MEISLGNALPSPKPDVETVRMSDLEAKLRALESRSLRKGCSSLDPARNKLIGIGMEVDSSSGKVSKDSFGVFNLRMIIGHGRCFSTILLCEKSGNAPGNRSLAGLPPRSISGHDSGSETTRPRARDVFANAAEARVNSIRK